MENRKYFIVDVEVTGPTLRTDCILEIAILELDWINDFWIAGRNYHRILPYRLRPDNAFASTQHQELYHECANADDSIGHTPNHVRGSILEFFACCGCSERDQIRIMGWDAAAFDLPMLCKCLYLFTKEYRQPKYGNEQKEIIWGDYNYLVYEISGAFALAQDILGKDVKTLKEDALKVYDFPVPSGKPNRALYDCYTEAKLLNGLIKLIREFQNVD